MFNQLFCTAKFRKTCEELALLGFTQPDVYLIDIDGNGKFPPAHVKCEFQSLEDWKTKTIVEHNLPSQIVSVIDSYYAIIVNLYQKSLKMFFRLSLEPKTRISVRKIVCLQIYIIKCHQ